MAELCRHSTLCEKAVCRASFSWVRGDLSWLEMDRCMHSRMAATWNSSILCRDLGASRSRGCINPQSCCSDRPMGLLARRGTRHRDSIRVIASMRGKEIPDDSVRRPLRGAGDSLRKRSFVLSDRTDTSGVVVSEDDIHRHREVLEKFFTENYEATLAEDEEEEEKVDNEWHSQSVTSSAAVSRWDKESEVHGDGTTSSWWNRIKAACQVTPHARGIILLNLLTFLYGSNISVIKNAGVEMDPTLFSFGRFAIASLAFAPFLRGAVTNKKFVNISAELGLWASMGYLTQSIAVLTSEASRVSFISTFTVIVVPLLAGLTGVKISKITWGSAFAALVGVAFLESGGAPPDIGDFWSFVSAVMFGVHMLRTEQHSVDLLPEDSPPIISLQMVVITLCAGVWSLGSHLSTGDVHPVSWSQLMQEAPAIPWVAMLYTGFCTTAFCLWCELVSLRDVKATEAAVIYTLEPLWGAAFAWILMGERWGPSGWLGASFILGGCLTMQLFGHSGSLPEKEKTDSLPGRTKIQDSEGLEVSKEVPELTTSKRR